MTAFTSFQYVTPFWEWNGENLDQFESPDIGSSVTSNSESVVTEGGISWIKMEITTNGTGNGILNGVYLPIDTTPSNANYGIMADCLNLSTGNSDIGMIVACRYSSNALHYLFRLEDRGGGGLRCQKATAGPSLSTQGVTMGEPSLDNVNQGVQQLSVECNGQTFIRCKCGEEQIIYDSSPITSTGTGAIGITTTGTATTIVNLYRNIKMFYVS